MVAGVVFAVEPFVDLALVEAIADEQPGRLPHVDDRRRRVTASGKVEPVLDSRACACGAVGGNEDPLHAWSLRSNEAAGIRASPDSRLRLSRAAIGGRPEVAAYEDVEPKGMYARAVEQSDARLRELRRAQWEGFGLSAVFLAAAFCASFFQPAFALPLLFGGVTGTVLAARAAYRSWDLLDRLVGEPDAYAIAEVRIRALAETTLERRHSLAISLRLLLNAPGSGINARVAGAADDLEALIRDLDDDELVLDPAAAVACARLLSDPMNSPLLDARSPAEDVRSRVRHIRSGFDHGRLAA
jgi:hypothetical protein